VYVFLLQQVHSCHNRQTYTVTSTIQSAFRSHKVHVLLAVCCDFVCIVHAFHKNVIIVFI
jgi:hypothetical protein